APNAPGQYFNIAMGQATSLNQLVDMLNELIGTNIRPSHAPPRTGDIKHSTADVTKIRDTLGFTPKINLIEGLRETVEWYRK
ncbi:MAG: LPS biosynthesis protein WbpP, partial [Chloroflexota bacterium]